MQSPHNLLTGDPRWEKLEEKTDDMAGLIIQIIRLENCEDVLRLKELKDHFSFLTGL